MGASTSLGLAGGAGGGGLLGVVGMLVAFAVALGSAAVAIGSVAVGGGAVLVKVAFSVAVLVGGKVAVSGMGDGVLTLGAAVSVAVGTASAAISIVGWLVGVGGDTAVWLQPISKNVKMDNAGRRNLFLDNGLAP